METRFPTDLKPLEWLRFPAEGFKGPACGVIHRKKTPASNGMPLGAIDTGCVDLETDGTFGYCTLFNSHVPRRGPLNLPFLGLSIRHDENEWIETWVLSTRKLSPETSARVRPDWPTRKHAWPADDIHYWGHYPIADLEYEMDCPLSVGLRAWSPFVPGDVALSSTPGAVFEVRLRNTTDAVQAGMLAFSFPGPSPQEAAGNARFEHVAVEGAFTGVRIGNGLDHEYALGFVNPRQEESYRTGGDLGCDGGYWSTLGSGGSYFNRFPGLPHECRQAGASVGVNFEIKPNEDKTIRFILAWYSPTWKSGGGAFYGGNTYYHKYAERHAGCIEVAEFLAANHHAVLDRIIAWQEVIYSEDSLPVWLRESLVNILHLIAEDGMWAQARPPIGEWCRREDGLFAMNECPRGCPQMECIPCSFYGNIPLVYFFPELALSTLRGYKAYQFPEGNAPFVFGGSTCGTPPCEMARPSKHYGMKPQTTLDGPCYVAMIERLWRRTGDRKILDEFYQSMKKNTIFTMNLRPESGAAGIVSMPSGNNANDWFESCDLFGIVPHIGGIHLANLRMAERMAREMGDLEFAGQCAQWRGQGSGVLEEKTWLGGCYMLYHEEETGRKSDVIMGCQLDGEWMVKSHGLESVFRPDRVKTTLKTLATTNVYEHGAIVFRLKEEDGFLPGYWGEAGVHFPNSIMLAATYMYHGERDFGLDLARRTVRALIIGNGGSWNSILLFRGDNGEFLYGPDYYQNMMLWCLPAALAGESLEGPCQPGGLVDRILKAGAGGV